MTTHETNPPRSPIEQVLIRLALQTPQFGQAGGGTAELTTADIAAAAAGYRDPIGEHLLGVLQADDGAVRRCSRQLHIYGWGRWLADKRPASIDIALHERLCRSAVLEYQAGEGHTIRDLKALWKCGGDRVRGLMPHYLAMVRELRSRGEELGQHMASNLRDVESCS